jgi:hypothetical protein
VVTEIHAGACHALQMVVGLVPGASRTLLAFGTEDQRRRYGPGLASGEWLATMCLTEAQAGSDLGLIRMRAVEAEGGWRLRGEKIFISGGDQDLTERILHLVLARTGDPESGTAGLSLFLCPSHDAAGIRNRVSVTRIEEKMGLHASPTCQLAFDDAAAELLGRPGGGIEAMFTMMDHARLDVALQGVAHAARSADVARAYAAERRQGRRPGVDGAVPISRHPDVARMLATQDALALGARAMCHDALVALATGEAPALVEFLIPVCKAFCTEAGIRAADLAIQTLGGYGYLREYRVEQTFRDARITSIYEGTNGIHALAVAGRQLRHEGGRAAAAFDDFVAGTIAAAPAGMDVAAATEMLELWRSARRHVATAEDPAGVADAFIGLSGLVAFQAAWLRLEAAADRAADSGRIRRLAAFVRAGGLDEARLWASRCRSLAGV